MRACAGTPPPGTEVVVMETLAGFPYLPALWLRQAKPAVATAIRASRDHDFLGLRLASARQAGNHGRVPGPSREGLSRAKPVLAHALRSRSAYARPVGCVPGRPRRAWLQPIGAGQETE